ncbi:MAG: ATP-dependent Clp protease ATP-binding subunit ClpB [Candidatus Eremiobacteraeota bacterium]|nr:ATP-dependent Clp protease ATP-binding subunit ClpB [Candidatus Eremiobacteraeota bacterium]
MIVDERADAQRDGEAARPHWPRWLEEVDLALPICAQFVLHGNIRDVQLMPSSDGPIAVGPVQLLWVRLRERGYAFLLVYERADGLRVHPKEAAPAAERALREHLPWLQLAKAQSTGSGAQECAAARLPEIVRALDLITTRAALVVENASRLVTAVNQIQDAEHALFATCERLARSAAPKRSEDAGGQPLFNAVLWLVNGVRDLPDWFVIGNERVRAISVPRPDFEARRTYAAQLVPSVEPALIADKERSQRLTEQFALQTDGLTLRAMEGVAQIARDQKIPLQRIADAVRCYKVGVPDDPWRKPHLRDRIRLGEDEFRFWVKGQDPAIRKALDILTRSVMGLSGAHASSSASRPRGVLFLAGPTGVGKTELAKAIGRLVFGDADACIRFDMSEFSAEHSDARLIGAPPGYVGYDNGGELVNAVRQRPFSVLLFDEIEKAHPRILDKFLQVLEDGRLTDGRGDTVHFSETVVVFTSNLGIYRRNDKNQWVQDVKSSMPPPEVERRVRTAIEEYFRLDLQRPELLNRIGDNIVVFDFIRPEIAEQIFAKALLSVIERVRQGSGLEIVLADVARERLLSECIIDLDNGGRGIGNKLEACFVNPLARSLFQLDAPRGATVSVDELIVVDTTYALAVSCESE